MSRELSGRFLLSQMLGAERHEGGAVPHPFVGVRWHQRTCTAAAPPGLFNHRGVASKPTDYLITWGRTGRHSDP